MTETSNHQIHNAHMGQILSTITGIVLCGMLAFIVLNPTAVDSKVLLEDKNPGYWDYLRPDTCITKYIPTRLF